ncbi:hypothetical protein FACS1894186_4200 [Alphaproteobacteria bacterium]|nr:hypothetical protein FACS1894186_4200 [Alphaproteobacteria bacterium]
MRKIFKDLTDVVPMVQAYLTRIDAETKSMADQLAKFRQYTDDFRHAIRYILQEDNKIILLRANTVRVVDKFMHAGMPYGQATDCAARELGISHYQVGNMTESWYERKSVMDRNGRNYMVARLVEAGYPAREIARLAKISPVHVYTIAHQRGVRRRTARK